MMDASNKNSPCKECVDVGDGVQLQADLEHLQQHLAERDGHIVSLEAEFVKTSARVNNLEEQVDTWREKYERLYDSHKRVQKLNQVLEDKLLQMVDRMKSEKSQLTKDIATLSVRLAESKHNYSMLQKENERYKNDMNLAIQLLQCKPDNFVSQKLDNLSVDTQARVSQYVMSKSSKPTSSTLAKNGNDDTFDASEYDFNISASLMTKILEDSVQDSVTKHCDTCTCTKSQNKPFCYNESYYSVATQTALIGDMKNSLCLNCNADIKSTNSNLSIRSSSPHGVKVINNRTPTHVAQGPLYIIPQPVDVRKVIPETANTNVLFDVKPEEITKSDLNAPIQNNPKIAENMKHFKRNSVNMEPSVHHKLCDRTKTSISSKISSNHSVGNEDLLPKEIPMKDPKLNGSQISSCDPLRKSSHDSALSRASSVAKSTVSTHKSSSQVGPGPRFCHLRMQAGSKNILLDNAEPDVPPVLYRRQSKCNEHTIFKDLNDGLENFINLEKPEEVVNANAKNDNVVVESTLIDVHVDSSNKECNETTKTPINPVLLNVSSSPLQPLKTHNFSNSSENNNTQQNLDSQQNTSVLENLLKQYYDDINNAQNNNNSQAKEETENQDVFTATGPIIDNDVKIFNFDRYEQNKMVNQCGRPIRKIDMSQLHSIENTRISKDLFSENEMPKIEKKSENAVKSALPAIVNVYPNLTQTHLKVNENKRVFTNEQSTSSLSSDDSAALLQKQQLLRVAEWVEQNLEQQNNFNDPLEDEVSFNNRMRRDSKLSRLTETLNEIALNMPHPVSKYSKAYNRAYNNYVHNIIPTHSQDKTKTKVINNFVKETIFPVESNEATVTAVTNELATGKDSGDFEKEREKFNTNRDKEITPEDLARMEYNVKKFLLSGHNWANPGSVGRSRRTSSKTETDV